MSDNDYQENNYGYIPRVYSNPLDCRSETGVIVGLIDGMIAQARVVARYLAEQDGVLPHEVFEALLDIRADEDVAAVTS